MISRRILILSILLILAGAHLIFYAGWTHDDPFITFRYVQNVAAGEGFVFNAAERVEGYSNFLFLLLLLPVEWIGAGLLGAARLYGLLFALGTLLIFFSFLVKNYPDMRWHRFLAAGLLALSGDAALWAVSGMETAVSLFFVTAGWIFFCRETRSEQKIFPWSALFLLGAALNRPEGGICFFALLAFSLATGKRPRRFLLWILLFLAPFALYNGWRLLYFGRLFPNTFYAKATGGLGIQIRAGTIYLLEFLERNPYLLLFALFLPFLLKKKITPERGSAAFLVFAQALFILVCGGDWMPLGRFMTPVLAPLFFLFQEGLFDSLEGLKSRGTRDPAFKKRDLLGLACLVLVILSLVREARETRPIMYSLETGTLYRPHIEIGLWLRENVPPGSLLAGEEAGIIPYYSRLPFLDLLGIVDPHIASREGPMHEKHDVSYVLSRRPDYVLLATVNSCEEEAPLRPLVASGHALMSSPRFLEIYTPVRSFPHGNPLLGKDYRTLFTRKP